MQPQGRFQLSNRVRRQGSRKIANFPPLRLFRENAFPPPCSSKVVFNSSIECAGKDPEKLPIFRHCDFFAKTRFSTMQPQGRFRLSNRVRWQGSRKIANFAPLFSQKRVPPPCSSKVVFNSAIERAAKCPEKSPIFCHCAFFAKTRSPPMQSQGRFQLANRVRWQGSRQIANFAPLRLFRKNAFPHHAGPRSFSAHQ